MEISKLNSKKQERGRHIYRAACNFLLLFLETAVFYAVWINCYNPYFRNPYVFKGNIFAALVYLCLQVLMNRFYGGLKLGYSKSFNIIFGFSITAVLTNFVGYFIIIMQAATWFLSPVPAMIYMSLIDIVIVIVWGLTFNRLFRRIFPPNRMLLIAGSEADETMSKFSARSDRYYIEKTIIITDTDGMKYVNAADNCCGDNINEAAADRSSVLNAAEAENFHDISDSGTGYGGSDKTGSLHEALEELKAHYNEFADFDGVVIGDLTSELRNDILKNCYARGIRTYTMPKITDVILKSSEILEVFDSPLFLNRNSGLSLEQAFVKRLSDIVMSLIGIIIASPFMLVISIAIKLEDGGPVFFRQRRCTIGGKEFDILKFRSMIVNAEQSGISVPATERDPRITKVGRVIRATRLDELPQIINILRGEMSVVGPRPERIEHVNEYCEQIPEFKYRMSVKGGLTGYAQVYGKYNTTPYDKLKLDLLYIQNYSIILDLEIILKTVQVLFTKESTEGFDKKSSEKLSEASRKQAGRSE